jgi:protein TonB
MTVDANRRLRGLSWLSALGIHAGIVVLLLFGGLLPRPRPPEEKPVMMDLSAVLPETTPPAAPPPPPPPPRETPPPDSSERTVAVAPVPESPQSGASSETVAPPAPAPEEEPEYLPQFKIEQLPQFPVQEILSKVVYPPLAAKQGLEATVILELSIDKEGRIRKIVVLKDPGFGFAEAAVKALDDIKVVPAQAGGQAAAVRYRYPIRFTLK